MILIDYRQGSKELVKYMPPNIVQTVTLDGGDVAWFGNGPEGLCTLACGLEYKTVGDAVSCMINKRFVGEQFPKMVAMYKRIYLLIEGEYRAGADGRLEVPRWNNNHKSWVAQYAHVSYKQFDNWQNSLTETGKVIIKRSIDRAESAAQCLDLYNFWTKDYESHSSLFAFDKSQLPPMIHKPSVKRLMFAQIPGVGWELSKRAEDKFETPYDGITAGEEQWEQISGIGKQKAKNIVKALRSQ